jgi:Stage II sporulation protein E (SpoIIE)
MRRARNRAWTFVPVQARSLLGRLMDTDGSHMGRFAAFALIVLTLACASAASGKKADGPHGNGGNGHGHGHGSPHEVEAPPPAPAPAPVAPAPAPQPVKTHGSGHAFGHGNGHGNPHKAEPAVTPPQEPAKPTVPTAAPTPSTGAPAPQPAPAPHATPTPTGTRRSTTRPRTRRRHAAARPRKTPRTSRRTTRSPRPVTGAHNPVFATPGVVGPAPSPVPGATAAGGTRKHIRHSSPPVGHATNRSPIVRSLERIVKVIPLAVKAVILVLGVLLVFASVAWFLRARTARFLRRHREMLLEEVGVLQGALLPAVPAELNKLQASVAYRPAEGMAAGGDFYDAFTLDDGRVGIVVGDVAGHGKDALMHTALLRYTLRAYLEADLEPRAALQVAGRALDRGFDTLATVALAVYDPNARVLRYACAGHPPPVFLGDADHVPVTVSSSPPIGAGLPTGLRQTTVCLPADSAVCFFTDGLIEARRGDQMIGRLGLAEIIRELGPSATAREVLDRVAAEADRVDDDMAACMFRVVESGAEPASPRVEELEVRRGESLDVGLRRFLVACGAGTRAISNAIVRTDQAMRRHHAVVAEASVRADGTTIDIRAANVESFASAEARRDATVLAAGSR